MRLLRILTEFFINAFQITRPKPAEQRRAEWIIGGSVLATFLLVAGLLVALLVWAIHA